MDVSNVSLPRIRQLVSKNYINLECDFDAGKVRKRDSIHNRSVIKSCYRVKYMNRSPEPKGSQLAPFFRLNHKNFKPQPAEKGEASQSSGKKSIKDIFLNYDVNVTRPKRQSSVILKLLSRRGPSFVQLSSRVVGDSFESGGF